VSAEQAGTSVLLEDVAVPVQNLAKLCNGINEMFEKFDYHDGSAFGHALEGNLHLVFTQVPCRPCADVCCPVRFPMVGCFSTVSPSACTRTAPFRFPHACRNGDCCTVAVRSWLRLPPSPSILPRTVILRHVHRRAGAWVGARRCEWAIVDREGWGGVGNGEGDGDGDGDGEV
jgi:hypothetical protein